MFVILGGVNDILEFSDRWSTNNVDIVVIGLGISSIFFLIGFLYLLFSPPTIHAKVSKRVIHYGLLFITAITLLAWGYTVKENAAIDQKVVLLVAKIEGPEQEKYRLSEILLKELNDSVSAYDDVLVLPFQGSISEQDGSNVARQLGKKHHADIVVWGWYGTTDTHVLLTIYIENLVKFQSLPVAYANLTAMNALIGEVDSYSIHGQIEKFDDYSIQEQVSSEISSFVQFIKGAIRFEAKDFITAEELLSLALSTKISSGLDVDTSLTHILRGNARLYSKNFQGAIDDYTFALDSQYGWLAYANRGLVHIFSNEKKLEKAIADLSNAISLNPGSGNEVLYNSRAIANIMAGSLTEGLADATTAININPMFPPSYTARALINLFMGRFDDASSDLKFALDLDPELAIAHFSLCTLGVLTQDDDEAMLSCSNFLNMAADSNGLELIEFNLVSIAYNNRGTIHLKKKRFRKAVNDFSKAIESDPELFMAYVNRGSAYALSRNPFLAIDDYTTVLEMDTANINIPLISLNIQAEFQPEPQTASQVEVFRQMSLFNRGQLYVETGQTQKAIADFLLFLEVSNDPKLRAMASQQLRLLGILQE